MTQNLTLRFQIQEDLTSHFFHQALEQFGEENPPTLETTRYTLRFLPGEKREKKGENPEKTSDSFLIIGELISFEGDETEKPLFGLPTDSRFFHFQRSPLGDLTEGSGPHTLDSFFELILPTHSVSPGDSWTQTDSRKGEWNLNRTYKFTRRVSKDLIEIKGDIHSLSGSPQKVACIETILFDVKKGKVLSIQSEGSVSIENYKRKFLFSRTPKALNSHSLPDIQLETFLEILPLRA